MKQDSVQEPRKQAMGASPATDHRPDVRSRGAWAVACALAVLMRSGLSFLIYRRGRVIERPLSGSLGRPARRNTPGAGEAPLSAPREETPGDQGHGIGLRNVNERIRLNYGDGYGITVESVYGEGTVMKVLIPMRNNLQETTEVESNEN